EQLVAIADEHEDVALASTARARVEAARLDLSYTTVRAPIAGRAGRAQVTEGALVSAAAGTLMTTIEQVDPIFVNFSLPSSEVLAIRRDSASGELALPDLGNVEVRLVLQDGTLHGPAGRLDFLDLAVDEATGTTALRAEVPNPGRTLVPGQFVRVRVEAGVRPDALLVPQRAVTVTPQGASVLVVDAEGAAQSRPVELGALAGGSWRIESGLSAGDRVIVDGLQKVQPGMPVTVAAGEAGTGAAPGAEGAPAGDAADAEPAATAER
ncbi:MAG TPA: efflux RND transporter periplasmic adaptor subunit, partial [Thermoanaerobaculia bacterium]|nr:efflux RND transporter periplasmic adaptor subunit [Thermoanaerobaculia bacterium]